ncbi:MAG TPA: wax ester/triacylglycerol synthase domain-containing protein [Solirubrobacteraceae bacterium]|nr:wax ester/triacylglycerol synthase domain-containing protein [Solirubrobacteraceae bacterium]
MSGGRRGGRGGLGGRAGITAGSRYDRTVVRWGQGAEMSAYEAAIWHVSDRATLRAASVVVELLDATPDFERLIAGHAWALGRVPRLRQRVVSDPIRLGPPAWADTPVDLDYHMRRVPLGPGAEFADVLEVASSMHETTFDPARPLWEAALVEGLPGGQAAYVLKFHHAMADDLALVALFELLHSQVREPTVSGARQLPPPIHETCTPLRLSARHVLAAVHRTPLAGARMMRGVASAGAAGLRDPTGGAGRSAVAVRSAGRSLASLRWAGPELLRRRSPRRAFDAIDLPLDRLRAAGAAGGGRVADAALAATIDGIGRYHAALGAPIDELPVAVPLRVRLDGSGDRLPRARILAPAGPVEPAQRIATLSRLVAEAESRPHVDVLRAGAPLVSRAPTALVGRLLELANRPVALQGFVVSGLTRDAYLAGAQVLQMFSFAPTSGCALAMTLLSHQDTSCIAFNFDRDAIADPETMGRCLREAFAELVRDA